MGVEDWGLFSLQTPTNRYRRLGWKFFVSDIILWAMLTNVSKLPWEHFRRLRTCANEDGAILLAELVNLVP